MLIHRKKERISLEVVGAIAFILLIIIILLWIDYKWGQARNKQKAKQIIFPRRRSDVSVFTSGTELFQDFFTEIEQAKRHIHILFYIIKNDSFSQRFLKLLAQKAKNGIEVRLLVDRMGSYKLSKQAITSLKQNGVHFSYCFTPRFPFFFYHLQKRNHRKIAVIDGKIGYLGGLNIGKEYINEDPKLSPWHDYHLKMTGEGVQDLQTVFLTDWLWATTENLLKQTSYFPPLSPGKQEQQVFTVDGEGLEQTFTQLIRQAKKQITIGTPYFIPSETLLTQLREAISRGVQLTVIIPKTADHVLVKEAAYRSFRVLLQEGATILQFQTGFYHSKIMLIDDKVVDIGTANFDKRSLFLNSEINCLMYDALSIEQAKKCLSVDMMNSVSINEKALTNPNLFQKAKEAVACLMSPFL
jgi:cardiolipin synthase A/B